MNDATTWTEAHRREALLYLLARFAESAHVEPCLDDLPREIDACDVDSERGFRRAVVRDVDIDGTDEAVRRVRDFAEGRRIRETWWEVRGGGVTDVRATLATAREIRDNERAVWGRAKAIVRVTRVRRAP